MSVLSPGWAKAKLGQSLGGLKPKWVDFGGAKANVGQEPGGSRTGLSQGPSGCRIGSVLGWVGAGGL